METRHAAAVMFCLLMLGTQAPAAQSEHFKVTTLPAWKGQPFEPHAMNDQGQVVGLVHLGTGQWHLFLWERPSGLKDLGRVYPNPCDINNHGQIVGTAIEPGDKLRAFLREPDGAMASLGDLGGGSSEAVAINDRGQVVGQTFVTPPGVHRAFIWDRAGGMRTLEAPGGFRTRATAISDTGQVFGYIYYHKNANLRQRPCCWELTDTGHTQAMEAPGNDFHAMNGQGWVVGKYAFRNGGPHVVLWHSQAGIERLFPCEPEDSMYERSTWMVNDVNQVVCIEEQRTQWGQEELGSASSQSRRYLWDRAEGKIRLDAYLPPGTRRFDLRDLNNRGCILGIAHLDDEGRRAALLLEPR